jgi:hypothetical protein
MKRCRTCHALLPRAAFPVERRTRDGLRADCAACSNAHRHARRYRLAGVVGVAGRVRPVACNGCARAPHAGAALADLADLAAWLERVVAIYRAVGETD